MGGTVFATVSMRAMLATGLIAGVFAAPAAGAQTWGPVDAMLPAGGDACSRIIGGDDAAAIAVPDWTLSAWVDPDTTGTVRIAGFGDPATGPRRY